MAVNDGLDKRIGAGEIEGEERLFSDKWRSVLQGLYNRVRITESVLLRKTLRKTQSDSHADSQALPKPFGVSLIMQLAL